MKVIGVTGGIGSGKSVVCRIFSSLGIPVYDSDARARSLMETSEPLKSRIIGLFGPDAYTAEGLNRTLIAGQVFRDPTLLQRLNAIVHPAVAEDFESWKASQKNVPFVIKEAAILFESGAHRQTDQVIAVNAPENVRIQRVMERDGRTEEQIREMMRRQLTDEERAAKSDYVIVNDDVHPVLPAVLAIYHQLNPQA